MSRRPLLAAGAIAALALSPLAAPLGAAHSVTAGDCAVSYPEDSITDGQAVHGLTVTSGTIPTEFTGSILGVLKDGIAPGTDMIMARLTSSEIDRVGIWQGMSGSPVYSADGHLIGAVAYGLAAGPSPVAGITPIDAMERHFTAPATITLSRAAQRQVASVTSVSATEAAAGFTQLRMPVAVAGVSQRVLNRQPDRSWLPRDAYAAGTSTAGSSASDLVAGGNLGVTMSYGDITMGGIGTVTTVCNDRLVGFGHPMNFVGRSTYGLTSADAIYVQEDPTFAGFKVANIGAQAGTVTDDRLEAVTGTLGTTPPTIDVTTTITHGADSRTGASHVQMPEAAAAVSYYALETGHDVVLDARQAGSELGTWTISGTHDGIPFTLDHTDRQMSTYDITESSSQQLPNWVQAASLIAGVKLTSITWTSTVSDEATQRQVSKLEQLRKGVWTVVNRTNPARGRAGHSITIRVTMTGAGVAPVQSVSKMVLPSALIGRARLLVAGNFVGDGFSVGGDMMPPTTYAALAQQIKSLTRQDTFTSVLAPAQLAGLPPSMLGSVATVTTSAPQPSVVGGMKRTPVIIR